MQEVKKQYVLEYPIAFHTTDFALIRPNPTTGFFQVLMIQKPSEVDTDLWRFPGGFVDPKDSSIKAAAKRELLEETGYIAKNAVLVDQVKINDPRYENSDHAIFTSFFIGRIGHDTFIPSDGFATDDAAKSKWFDMAGESIENKLTYSNINPVHKDLLKVLYNPRKGWKKIVWLMNKNK
jgi:bifunctional NMN adenylyltransferase/nudix hydrolase